MANTSSDLVTQLLPIMVATAHTIYEQQNGITALSCVVIGNQATQQKSELLAALPEGIFYPVEYFSLSQFQDKAFSERYDLAVVLVDEMPVQAVDSQENTAQLSSITVNCRDLSARHCLVFAPIRHNFTAFGFVKFTNQPYLINGTPYYAWQFNLFDYKVLPDWYNSRFWANPENWNKFRW